MSDKFKKGDIIICDDCFAYPGVLTEGERYEVIACSSDGSFIYVTITNDDGELYDYLSYRFTLSVESVRNDLIDNILK